MRYVSINCEVRSVRFIFEDIRNHHVNNIYEFHEDVKARDFLKEKEVWLVILSRYGNTATWQDLLDVKFKIEMVVIDANTYFYPMGCVLDLDTGKDVWV